MLDALQELMVGTDDIAYIPVGSEIKIGFPVESIVKAKAAIKKAKL